MESQSDTSDWLREEVAGLEGIRCSSAGAAIALMMLDVRHDQTMTGIWQVGR